MSLEHRRRPAHLLEIESDRKEADDGRHAGHVPHAFRSVVDIDLLGSYHVLRAAHPMLRKPGAVVINASAPQALLRPAPRAS